MSELLNIEIKPTTFVNCSYFQPNEKEYNVIFPTKTYDVSFYQLKGRNDKAHSIRIDLTACRLIGETKIRLYGRYNLIVKTRSNLIQRRPNSKECEPVLAKIIEEIIRNMVTLQCEKAVSCKDCNLFAEVSYDEAIQIVPSLLYCLSR